MSSRSGKDGAEPFGVALPFVVGMSDINDPVEVAVKGTTIKDFRLQPLR